MRTLRTLALLLALLPAAASAQVTVDSVRAEAVRSRAFIRGAETQLTKVLALLDSLQGGAAPAPDPDTTTPPPPPPPQTGTNEPAGMTRILSSDGSDKFFGTGGAAPGWFFGDRWNNNTYTSVVADASSPHGQAIEKRLFVGDQAGWNGLAQYDWSSTAGTKRHLYFRTIFKFSANYQICSTNEKPFGYLAYAGGLNDLYMGMQASGAWDLNNQGHAGAGWDYLGTGRINFTMQRGRWILLEIYAVGESTPGARDGELYVWIDGVSRYSATGLAWSAQSSHWRGMSLFNYWGGGGCTKTVNDVISIGEIYVSGR